MKLQKFRKNKKQKRIVIGSIIGVIAIIGGISLYRSFAMYKVEQSFDVLNGTVPEFVSGDLQLAITVDGKKEDKIPTKNDNNYGVVVSCDNATGSWDKEKWQAVLGNFNGSKVKCNLYFESTLSGYIKALAKVDASIIEEEHEETEQTPVLTDYRYIGKEPNNYVCLEDSDSCDDDKLYRIIGVIPTQKENSETYEDRVKLIKNTSYGRYLWSGSAENESNDWTQSTLNTDTLNKTYWNEIKTYQKYIENAKWYLGGVVRNTASNLYKFERSNTGAYSSTQIINTISQIGLLYPSDYSYATNGGAVKSREVCTSIMTGAETWGNAEYDDCKNNDWLFYINKTRIYTINGQTRGSGETVNANILAIYSTGGLQFTAANQGDFDVIPTFYLKKDVLYKSGEGTHDNPYRITIS